MKKDRDRLSYKLIVIFGICIVLLIIGSVVLMNVLLSQVKKSNVSQNEVYDRHYAFIHADDNTEFWNSVYEGALEQGEQMGVYVENFGDNLIEQYDRNDLIRMAIEASVDGLIIDGSPDEETAELINEASGKGIPVVTVMNDCPDSERISYVGISSYAMGRQYGNRIIMHLPKELTEPMRVYVIMNSGRAESGAPLVVSGIIDVFSELGYGNFIDVEGVYIDGDSTFSAEENIRDIFLKDELPDAIVGLDAVHTRCLFQAAVDYNKVGDVVIYGFDDSDDILDAVSKNIVEATLSVDTDAMGASCVLALEEYLNTGYVSDYFSQDTALILAAKADELLKMKSEESE